MKWQNKNCGKDHNHFLKQWFIKSLNSKDFIHTCNKKEQNCIFHRKKSC